MTLSSLETAGFSPLLSPGTGHRKHASVQRLRLSDNLNKTYLIFVKKGLVKVNSFTQQAEAIIVEVASLSLVGWSQVIVYVS